MARIRSARAVRARAGRGRVARCVLLAGGVLVVMTTVLPSAHADAPVQQAWWNKLRQGGLPAPAPPDAPADGLYVSVDPSGPAAIAAVRFASEAPGTLTLKLTTGNPSFAVEAHPATAAWQPVQNGDWSDAPK